MWDRVAKTQDWYPKPGCGEPGSLWALSESRCRGCLVGITEMTCNLWVSGCHLSAHICQVNWSRGYFSMTPTLKGCVQKYSQRGILVVIITKPNIGDGGVTCLVGNE